MIERIRCFLISALAIALSLFTIYEVNNSLLTPLSQLAVFAMLGLGLCFLSFPLHPRLERNSFFRGIDLLAAAVTVACCGYLIWHGKDLGARAGANTQLDFIVAVAGTLLVLEATRRSIGWSLPILTAAFLLYARFGTTLPDWAFAHRGYDFERIAAQTFLRTEGVFGMAMRVMFTYVFLFVVFGVFLEASGATQFIIDFAQRVFGRSPGGPAKVSVLGSGMMGSLSGSAVANAVTTGAFTIPMMRNAGFRPHIAGGITAAAASGGALMPPVMGAGAYMMLEIIDPPVTYVQIIRAAIMPAVLYYFSILLIVHLYSRRIGRRGVTEGENERPSLVQYGGMVFVFALVALIAFLIKGNTPFRAVTYSIEIMFVLSIFSPRVSVTAISRVVSFTIFALVTTADVCLGAFFEQVLAFSDSDVWQKGVSALATLLGADPGWDVSDWSTWFDAGISAMIVMLLLGLWHATWSPVIRGALVKAAMGGISLVAASGCVGVILGVVTLTGIGTAFPNAIVPLAQESLLMALIAIMLCSIILGMGLPSAVCYLLMAVLIGPVLNRLGVIPLAAHMFIFYFGMMSMVTPPVALAAYASASIAQANIMRTALAAFTFSLVGFTLPYMFVYRPELLLLSNKPEFHVVSARATADRTSAQTIIGRLERNGEGLPDAKIELASGGGSDMSREVTTDTSGGFRTDVAHGDWSVAAIDAEGRRQYLGELNIGDDATFNDRRLSMLQVVVGTGTAALGIVALAAGIAGYLFAPLAMPLRLLAFATAVLLLYPGRGFLLGGVHLAISDGVGLVLLAIVCGLNRRRQTAHPQNSTSLV